MHRIRPKRVLSLLIVFVLGVTGGIWAQAFLLPTMAANPTFANLQFIKDWNARTQVITPVQQIVITQDEAIERDVARLDGVVVGIKSTNSGFVRQGSGLVYTSDGLIVTLATLVPKWFEVEVYLGDDVEPIENVQVIKRDLESNLALLKIETEGLLTTGFANQDSIGIGEQVFLISKSVGLKNMETRANQGIVTAINETGISTNMQEQSSSAGSPIFTLKGSVVGLSFADIRGKTGAIPVSELRVFLGL